MKELFSRYSDQEALRIARLIGEYINGTISHNDHVKLDDWVAESDENMELFLKLTDEKNIAEAKQWIAGIDTEKALRAAEARINFEKLKRKSLWQRSVPYGIAAVVIIAAGLIVLKPFQKKPAKEIVESTSGEIIPGTDKAVLILNDGKEVGLGMATNKEIAVQGTTTISDAGGELTYSSATIVLEELYNTVRVPNGGQYKLILADGSKVWLNSGSSIRFPVSFHGIARTVSMTGEAYFEVTKDSSKPFFVSVGDTKIEVLGTKFNVSAYLDEPVIKTTLAEGKLRVTSPSGSLLLAPLEESERDSTGHLRKYTTTTEEALAWKDGLFYYKNEPIETIMRGIARWYDAQIEYRDKPGDHFNVELSRTEPVTNVLRLMELTNRVYFKIENKKIIVSKHKIS